METKSNLRVTPVYRANEKAYRQNKYRVISNQGSTRSSKTYSILQLLIRIASVEKTSITICSPSLPHLKRGAMRDFLDIMDGQGLYNENHFNRTDHVYYFPSGSYVEFFGVEDPGKVRGPGRRILYVNEADQVSFATYKQLALRTTQVIFIDFNPADEFSWVYDVSDDPANRLIISNYRNNLANLSKEQIQEIESLKDADENLWKVFGLGLRGTSSETIYTHWKKCEQLPLKGEIFYGQDFGYNVASALVRIEHYEGAIYVKQLLYQTKLTTNDLIEQYKNIGMGNTSEIYCDAAEPKTIEELCRAGYNAKPADKDVLEGIRKVKGMPLYITEDSIDLLKEIKSYKWKLNKEGKVLDEPVKFNDHACFVSDTMITCEDGLKKISGIRPGDRVLTSKGYKQVIKRFNNGVQQTYSYSIQFDTTILTLVCTPDHLIKTTKGWIPISELAPGMTIYLSSSSTEEPTNYTRMSDTSHLIAGDSMSTFGNILTEKSQRDSTFTTRMATGGITGLRTWNSRKQQNISPIISGIGLLRIPHGRNRFTKRESQLLPSGTEARKDANGIGNTPSARAHTCTQRTFPKNANAAEKSSLLPSYANAMIGSVPTNAKVNGGANRGLTTSSAYVNDVAIHLPSTNTIRPSIVRKAVVDGITSSKGTRERVYDLEVEDCHEYFANGALVHNCDALRYAVFSKLQRPSFDFDRFYALNN